MTFQYTARDAMGKILQGSLEAPSRESAAQLLYRDGFHVLTLQQGPDDEAPLFPRWVRKSDIIYATSQLAIMIDTGITLSDALEGICAQEDNPTLKKILLELKASVEAGDDFSTALARFPKYFDKTFVALVRSSEQTGRLAEMLEKISDNLRKELESRSKMRAALTYPAVMMCLAINVTLFLLTFVMPKFTPMFKSRQIELPTTTVVMMAVSESLIHYWYAWLVGAAALVVGFLVFRRTEPGRKSLDWLKINLPILGPLLRKVTLSRCIYTLGTMIQSGVQMLDAIKLTADVAGNYYYENSWHHVHTEITNGNRICDALAESPLYPKTLIQMIGSGEETGQLDTVLKKVSSYYDREVETSLKTVTSLIEPLIIAVMGAVVGTIGMSIMLPIFSLSRGGF